VSVRRHNKPSLASSVAVINLKGTSHSEEDRSFKCVESSKRQCHAAGYCACMIQRFVEQR
jgi:hypothetical protein